MLSDWLSYVQKGGCVGEPYYVGSVLSAITSSADSAYAHLGAELLK